MANIRELKTRVVGAIATMQTLTERYPSLLTLLNDGIGISVSPLQFLLILLQKLNVTEGDIIDWFSKFLTGKAGVSFLNVVEESIKAILLANIKGVFTCNINPLIPDDLIFTYTNPITGHQIGGEGITLNLDNLDTLGTLNNCPCDDDINPYFDVNNYRPKTVYKSLDFDAFLWYVINMGTGAGDEKCVWDNRNKYGARYSENPDAFLNETGEDMKRKKILRLHYSERTTKPGERNILRVWLDGERYARKIKIMDGKNGELTVNRSIFEFNYDYIYSLKLFDAKSLISRIVSSVLDLSSTVSYDVKLKYNQPTAKLRELVKKIMESEETTTYDDSFFSFLEDNEKYEESLLESMDRYNGETFLESNEGKEFYNELKEEIGNITKAATYNEELLAISKTVRTITDKGNGQFGLYDEGPFGLESGFNFNIISSLIEEMTTQIALTLFSPKIAMLYAINGYIMGENAEEIFKWDTWENVIKNFKNVIVSLVRQLTTIIINELLAWLKSIIKPLIALFLNHLLLEMIREYRDLIINLIETCTPAINLLFNGNRLVVESVDYADIIPKQIQPTQDD